MLLEWLRVPWILRRLGLAKWLDHQPLFEQIARFLIAGGAAAFSNLASMALFTEVFRVWYLISTGLASVISLITSFLFHKYWTFAHRHHTQTSKQFVMHAGLGIWNVFFGMALIYVFVEWLHVYYLLGQVMTIAIASTLNFLMYRFVIFRRETPELATIDALAELD